jgi:prevent-host-death family protein
MKTIEIERAKKPLSQYAKEVRREPVLVVSRGKPVAVLSSARGMDAESIALANSPKFAAIIERSRARTEKEGSIPIEEVRRRLGLAKKETARKNGK